jgi:hypothetical protein
MKTFKQVVLCAVLCQIVTLPSLAEAKPVEYVKVCTAYGANYYYSPGTETCINAQTGVTKRETENGTETSQTELASHVDEIGAAASIAAALTSPDLVAGEHFGVRVNWGNAGDSNAVGLSGAAVIGEGLFEHGAGRLTGTAGIAYSRGTVGGNAGLQLTW